MILRHSRPPEEGYTLLEIISMVAAVAVLSAIVTPMIIEQINASKLSRARSECQSIASALGDFFQDVGVFPSMDETGQLGKVQILLSGDRVPARNPFSQSTLWYDRRHSDILDNHLWRNAPGGSRPGYPTTGDDHSWRGPYALDTGRDPWGRPYLCNVLATYSTDEEKHRRTMVLSAGPNGVVETSFEARARDELAGDDIGVDVHRR